MAAIDPYRHSPLRRAPSFESLQGRGGYVEARPLLIDLPSDFSPVILVLVLPSAKLLVSELLEDLLELAPLPGCTVREIFRIFLQTVHNIIWFVGAEGFEPSFSCTRSMRVDRTTPRPADGRLLHLCSHTSNGPP